MGHLLLAPSRDRRIHSRRDASAASLEEEIGNRVWGGAFGTRGGAAARGLFGTGAGTPREILSASKEAAWPATACLSTLARASRLGVWGEVSMAAARITGTRARNCGELSGDYSNEAGPALRIALANAAGVA